MLCFCVKTNREPQLFFFASTGTCPDLAEEVLTHSRMIAADPRGPFLSPIITVVRSLSGRFLLPSKLFRINTYVRPTSVASKGLTMELTYLESTLMKKPGGGGLIVNLGFFAPKSRRMPLSVTGDHLFQPLIPYLQPLTCGIIPPHMARTRFQERGGFSE